jgi:hypothetical protein
MHSPFGYPAPLNVVAKTLTYEELSMIEGLSSTQFNIIVFSLVKNYPRRMAHI